MWWTRLVYFWRAYDVLVESAAFPGTCLDCTTRHNGFLGRSISDTGYQISPSGFAAVQSHSQKFLNSSWSFPTNCCQVYSPEFCYPLYLLAMKHKFSDQEKNL
ncbi:hypothetical protein RRG08_037596 [Elysia crispata]|uniref:Uncharacterized protein n=1 Tax=Elysia crispata TaxID=231223 RepID=A0AAE1CYA5_9GAST|nr:hypothetical protein RRG08_037596 [Elysia crispata]